MSPAQQHKASHNLGLYDLLRPVDHGVGSKPNYLNNLAGIYFLGWICTTQILHNVPYDRYLAYDLDDLYRHLSDVWANRGPQLGIFSLEAKATQPRFWPVLACFGCGLA